jgi:hypothetical protein
MVFGFGKKDNKQKKLKKSVINVSNGINSNNKKKKIDLQEKIEKGYLNTKIILEVLGAPKEHIEKTLYAYVEKAKGEQGIDFVNADFADTKEEEKLFSKFVEVEFLFKNMSKLIGFCFDYMPSSIEIIDPENLNLSSSDLSMLFNDLQAKLHHIDMTLKQVNIENKNLKDNAAGLLRNLIFSVIQDKTLPLKELSNKVGIVEEQLAPFLNALVKKGLLKEEKGKYLIIKEAIIAYKAKSRLLILFDL